MKKLALVAMMVLGSASMAAAAPRFSASFQARGSFRLGRPAVVQPVQAPSRMVIVRDHRTHEEFQVMPCNDRYYDVSGFYQGPAGDVMLTQRGNRIYGTFANGGVMNGVIENGKITYTWTGAGYSGLGFWYVDGRGRLIGTWGSGNSDASGGNWNLRLAHR